MKSKPIAWTTPSRKLYGTFDTMKPKNFITIPINTLKVSNHDHVVLKRKFFSK